MGQEGNTSVMSTVIYTRFTCPGLLCSTHFPCPRTTAATSVISTPTVASAVGDLHFFHAVGILVFTRQFFMPVFIWLKYCEFCFQIQLEALASVWSSRKCFHLFCRCGTKRKCLPRLLRKKLSHVCPIPCRTWTWSTNQIITAWLTTQE